VAWHAVRAFDAAGPLISRSRGSCVRMGFYERSVSGPLLLTMSYSGCDATGVGTKVVSRGDSLWHISRITYGDGTRYAIVCRANRDRIRDPNLIHPRQILFLLTKRR